MITKHALLINIATIFLLFSFKLALAAIPTTLNYQGHLTDSSGVPIDGPVSMVFAIYDIDTGGTALWSNSRSVTVEQGVFSVELGGTSNPFPLGLFENPLWMGLTVGTDAEMAPRRPISSVGFSFKAGDANTLEGVSASTLDQSTHVIDTANPHSVSAEQIGAANDVDFTKHITNSLNPHSVTAVQTGAATSTDFTTHTSNSAAHHLRYTNTEAIIAMGVKNNANALNHDRYADPNAVAAMLAADGTGSTLDADLVDGLQASELIDAAQDEVRTPISSLPYTITQSGSYYLTGNLDGSSGGIDITADDVTLDMMGFTIDGGGTVNDDGINFTHRSNITIRNGTIKGFGLSGIIQGNTSIHYATVMDVQTLGNGTLGTGNFHSGIYILSHNSHVERCIAGDNGGNGIVVYLSSKLINNIAYNNSGYYGIDGSAGTTLSGNAAYSNTGVGGIYGGSGAILTGNTAYSNSNWGVYSVGSNLIEKNSIYNNNMSGTVNQGGLRVSYDSRVVGNMLDGNIRNNIYVGGTDNALIDNHVVDSTNGINFTVSGNYYRNNTASGNTTANYAGSIPTGSGDGGGNASF